MAPTRRVSALAAVLLALPLTGCALQASPSSAPPPVVESEVGGTSAATTLIEWVTPEQFPQGERYPNWRQVEPQPDSGPAAYCVTDLMTGAGAQTREFISEADAGGAQFLADTGEVADATALVAALEAKLVACAAESDATDREAVHQKISSHEVGDGMAIEGIFSTGEGSEDSAHVYAIGRDGSRVTVLHLGQMGDRETFPMETFTAMALAAMGQDVTKSA